MIERVFRASRVLYLSVTVLLLLAGCVQHTLDPTQTNAHIVRIETVKPTGTIEPNVAIQLFEDNTATAAQDFSGNTGDTGAVNIHLNIPTFGHSYSLRVQKNDALGQLIYARTIYPLTLSCVDTTIVIVIPDADTSHPTDALCNGDVSRTLTFYACPDTAVTQNYVLTNCSSTAYVVTASTLAAPFSISPTTATIQAGASQQFTITYDGRGQTADASAKETLTTTPASGNAILTLIGHLQQNCNATTQNIQCGVNSTSDSVRFGTVCQNQTTGTQCVSFVNTNTSAVTVTFPAAPAPYSYTVTDKNGASVNTANGLTLQKGESMTLCFSIDPTTIGAQNATLVLPMQCVSNGTKFTYTIPISATSKLCNTCTCTDYFHDPVKISNNIQVGKDTTFTAQIFKNPLNCAVTISNLVSQTPNEWTVLSESPTLPALVAPGGTVNATVNFKPTKSGVATDNVTFSITIAGSTTAPCTGNVTLTATGCNDACANEVMPPEWLPSPAPNGPDTLFFKQQGNPQIFVSSAGANSVSDQECITIKYPDTACATKQLTIVSPKGAKWTVTTTPSPLTVSPGGTAQVCLTFTAPTIAQVRQDFTLANEELKYTDVLQIIDPAGCSKVVPLKAVVDTLPQCKEFDLAQYGFVGTGQVVYDESYLYDNGRQDNVAQGAPGVPSTGDMYLKTPTLFSNITGATTPGYFHWKNDKTPICDNIQPVTTQLGSLGPNGQTYASTVTFAQYDWIVVRVHPGTYAVIQVTATYTDGFNIPHAVCSVLYPFHF